MKGFLFYFFKCGIVKHTLSHDKINGHIDGALENGLYLKVLIKDWPPHYINYRNLICRRLKQEITSAPSLTRRWQMPGRHL